MKINFILILIAVVIISFGACHTLSIQKDAERHGPVKLVNLENKIIVDKIMKNNEGQNYKHGEVLVKFKSSVSKETIDSIADGYGLEMIKLVSPPSLYLFRISGDSSVKDIVQKLNKLGAVEYSEPNFTLKLNSVSGGEQVK